ncbi:MAG: hypothetical protein OXN21_04655 [Chloroflexota bacterium]|nr:hypothetical protein [Chloroflexota bacterium]
MTDLYELTVGRYRVSSFVITSNRVVEEWLDFFDKPIPWLLATGAGTILRRLGDNSVELNNLETKFFNSIVDAELGVPVPATLAHEDGTMEVILVPELTDEGEFTLKYYNAPSSDPETQRHESGITTETWTFPYALGLHPVLERAWLHRRPVTVQMHPPGVPLNPRVCLHSDLVPFRWPCPEMGIFRNLLLLHKLRVKPV